MLTMLLLLWILSPVLLIPMYISANRQNQKNNEFINSLLREERISWSEYTNLRTESKTDEESLPKAPEPEPAIKLETPVIRETEFRHIDTEIKVQPAEYEMRPEPRRTNSTSILFGIGVVFIILAGFVFSTAFWVYLSDVGRTFVIGVAAALFFGISALAHKKFRLESTGTAFYMLGSVFSAITFITAGIFRLFGDWFSIDGSGAKMFISVSSLVVTLFSVIGVKIYRKNLYTYSALYTALFSVTMMFVQISDSIMQFGMMCSIFGACCSAAHYYVNHCTDKRISTPFTTVLNVMRVLYVIPAFLALIYDIDKWGICSWTICLIYTSELTVYGILKKNKLMLSAQCILVLGILHQLWSRIAEATEEYYGALFGITISMLVLAIVYRYIKKIYTVISDLIFTIPAFIISIVLLDDRLLPYGLLSMLAYEAVTLVTAFDKNNIFSLPCRLILPIPLMIICGYSASEISRITDANDCYAYAFTICAAVFAAIAAACIYAIKRDIRFKSVKYSFEVFAGFILIASGIGAITYPSCIFIIMLSVAVYVLIQSSDNNFHSVLAVAALFSGIGGILDNIPDRQAAADASVIISISMCALFTFASRILYGRKFYTVRDTKSRWDMLSIGILLSLFFIREGTIFGSDAGIFIGLIEIAVFTANLYRTRNSRNSNLTVLTIAAGWFALALINRPFLKIEDAVWSSKIILLIIASFGLTAGTIWRENKRVSGNLSSSIYMFTYILLLFDGLINETSVNSLIVLVTSLAILIYSFITKKKRWFLTSAVGLTGLTLYIAKDFFAHIQWWVYLMLVGILLISIAAVNEYFKSKGESVKEKAGRFFEDWTW